MISVLQNWQEIGEAILELQRQGLPTHNTAQKNWDHLLLHRVLASFDKQSVIVDMGCGDGHTLAFLDVLGFKNIHGVDLRLSWQVRARQLLRMWRRKTLVPPFHLRKGDITRTLLPPHSSDLAISISTIEHGVDVAGFFAEARRILKPGGLLFVTTDYWEDKIRTDNSALVYGLSWEVFCRDEIQKVVRVADSIGLRLCESSGIPQCSGRPVFWQNTSYTFLSMLFQKTAD